MSNFNNGSNNLGGNRDHEQAEFDLRYDRIHVRPGEHEIQQRIQQYGGGQGSSAPGYTNNVGGPQVSNTAPLTQTEASSNQGSFSPGAAQSFTSGSVSGQSYGVNGSMQYQNGIPQLSYEQLQNEYMARFPRIYGQPIVAVKHADDSRRNIVAFKLQNGQVLNYSQAIQAGFDRQLQGLELQNNQQGELILRSTPDGYRSNNLDNLPEFS